MADELVFIKLGGSLITDKNKPETARLALIEALARAIRRGLNERPEMKIVLGHGSGSFGHMAARQYNTREGVRTAEEWRGFQETWAAAHRLNQLVIARCHDAGLPVINFPPSAMVVTENHTIKKWDVHPMQAALEQQLMPVIFGDVVFDREIGGTILSTEDLFEHLSGIMRPKRILLAGIEPGVWADYPRCSKMVERITGETCESLDGHVRGSASVDVTGGMQSKVKLMCRLVRQYPEMQAQIFSAVEPETLYRAMLGEGVGTTISG